MAGFSPAAAILENEKTLGTKLQPTGAQGTHLKQLQLTGLPWLNMLLLLLLLLLLFYYYYYYYYYNYYYYYYYDDDDDDDDMLFEKMNLKGGRGRSRQKEGKCI